MAGGIYSPEMVIKNTSVGDIEISDGIITAVGSSEQCGRICTIDAADRSVTAGRIFRCGAKEPLSGEELLFSGYSTVIFERGACSLPVGELIKSAMNTLLNFAVISDHRQSVLPFDDGTLTPQQAALLESRVGSLSVGMTADIFIWDGAFPEKIIKGGKLIFDRSLTDRRDIIYTMAEPERSVFFTTRSAADGYIGAKLRGERRVVAVVYSDPTF